MALKDCINRALRAGVITPNKRRRSPSVEPIATKRNLSDIAKHPEGTRPRRSRLSRAKAPDESRSSTQAGRHAFGLEFSGFIADDV